MRKNPSENDTKRLWWLLPELLLWETFHGGYLLGLMAFVIWIGHRILPGSRSVTRQELGIMTGVTLGVGLNVVRLRNFRSNVRRLARTFERLCNPGSQRFSGGRQ